MGRAMIRAVVLATVLLVGGASAASPAGAAQHAKTPRREHCYRHVEATYHYNLDNVRVWWVKGGVSTCFRGRTRISTTPIAACASPVHTWTCTVTTRVLRLAGKPGQRRVLTSARFTPTPGSTTHAKTKAECFHIGSRGGVRTLCRLTPTPLTSADEQCTLHTSKTFYFNRTGALTRWGKGGGTWCVRAGKTVSLTSIARCGPRGGAWSCKAVTSVTPLYGHPQQKRFFTLETFLRTILGVVHRKGGTQCFHLRLNGNVRWLCRINHA